MRRLALAAAATLAACHAQTAASSQAAGSDETASALVGEADACHETSFEGSVLTDCIADPARDRIATMLASKDGRLYRSLAGLAVELREEKDAPEVEFAMNGGMFDDDGKPIGYYVEDGERLKKLNRNPGPGNFHLMPNGVFYGTGGKWQVRTTDWFAKT